MAMTQAQALTALRERLDEATATAWTDVQLRRWVNEAVNDIARRTETIQVTANLDVDAGDQDHTLPATTLRVYRAEYIEDNNQKVYPLEWVDFNAADSVWWVDQATTDGRPRIYTLWGYPPNLQIKLYPVPSVNGTLRVHYYSAPTALATDGTAASTNLSVPEGYTDLVLDYAEYKALRRDRDPRWQEAKAEYEQHLEQMTDMTRRWSDQASSISLAGYGLPDWLVGGWDNY